MVSRHPHGMISMSERGNRTKDTCEASMRAAVNHMSTAAHHICEKLDA